MLFRCPDHHHVNCFIFGLVGWTSLDRFEYGMHLCVFMNAITILVGLGLRHSPDEGGSGGGFRAGYILATVGPTSASSHMPLSSAHSLCADSCQLKRPLLAVAHRPLTHVDCVAVGRAVPWWEVLELSFTLVYTLEMVVKIVLAGLRQYCAQTKNMFDGTVTGASSPRQ